MNLTLEDMLRFHEFDVLQWEMLENTEEKLHVYHKKKPSQGNAGSLYNTFFF